MSSWFCIRRSTYVKFDTEILPGGERFWYINPLHWDHFYEWELLLDDHWDGGIS